MTKSEQVLVDMIYNNILKIDELGLVWKIKKKHKEWVGYKDCIPTLQGSETDNGYIRLTIRDENGITRKAQAHRVIFIYNYGDIPEGIQVNHKDGIKHNNKIDNLELMTPSQQMIHAINILGRKIGNRTCGENRKGVHSKITKEEKEEIINSKFSSKELSMKYNITRERINQIKRGE